jgi:hypothetical protein
MILDRHVWRTVDGSLVLTGDPAAVVLAYTKGDEFNDHEWERLGLKDLLDPEPDPAPRKASVRTASKAVTDHEDK